MITEQERKTWMAILRREYAIMVEDTGKTFNINAHTFNCFAVSEDEAVGIMIRKRPEFKNREILSIRLIEPVMD